MNATVESMDTRGSSSVNQIACYTVDQTRVLCG